MTLGRKTVFGRTIVVYGRLAPLHKSFLPSHGFFVTVIGTPSMCQLLPFFNRSTTRISWGPIRAMSCMPPWAPLDDS